jgi:hypothetical protein
MAGVSEGRALVLFPVVVGAGIAFPEREYHGDVLRMEELAWIRTTSHKPCCMAGMRGARQSRLPGVSSGESYR